MAGARSKILAYQADLRSTLRSVLLAKFEFWKHTPWKALAAYNGQLGGSLAIARERLGEAMDEHDKAGADGDGARLHRVSWLFCRRGTRLRRELEEFRNCGRPLAEFPAAFVMVQRYALANV